MKILVIGASGKTGQKLLKHLSATTHEVRGLIRKPEQEEMVRQFGATPLLGDLAGNVKDIAKRFDAILFVAGSAGKHVQEIDYQGLIKVVDSALNYNVKRFIYLSSINIDKKPAQFLKEMREYYQQNSEVIPKKLLAAAESQSYHIYLEMKTLAENKIISSTLNYTILRAGLLTQEEGTGKVDITAGMLQKFGKISRDNVARCFIEILENKATYRKIFTIIDGKAFIAEAFYSVI